MCCFILISIFTGYRPEALRGLRVGEGEGEAEGSQGMCSCVCLSGQGT